VPPPQPQFAAAFSNNTLQQFGNNHPGLLQSVIGVGSHLNPSEGQTGLIKQAAAKPILLTTTHMVSDRRLASQGHAGGPTVVSHQSVGNQQKGSDRQPLPLSVHSGPQCTNPSLPLNPVVPVTQQNTLPQPRQTHVLPQRMSGNSNNTILPLNINQNLGLQIVPNLNPNNAVRTASVNQPPLGLQGNGFF